VITRSREPEKDPDSARFDPKAYIERADISNREKIRQLENWRSDLIQLQRATEENMPAANTGTGETSVRLARVTAALATLRKRIDRDR
jgi:hypothetical protein